MERPNSCSTTHFTEAPMLCIRTNAAANICYVMLPVFGVAVTLGLPQNLICFTSSVCLPPPLG